MEMSFLGCSSESEPLLTEFLKIAMLSVFNFLFAVSASHEENCRLDQN